jgi:hypothetical protein
VTPSVYSGINLVGPAQFRAACLSAIAAAAVARPPGNGNSPSGLHRPAELRPQCPAGAGADCSREARDGVYILVTLSGERL